MTGDTRGRNGDPLEVNLEVRGQSDDFAADSSGVGDGDGVSSNPNARIDDPTSMHGKPARHCQAVVGADGKLHRHACHRVHTRQKQA
jgi:hypothetical protein